MAKEKEKEERSLEEIQRQIAEVELQTKTLLLDQARRSNDDFLTGERRRKEANQRRMAELDELRRNHEATVKRCRHRSGGTPKDIQKGGGIGSFSIISRAILPDGVTILLQCPRCRMLKYPPSDRLKKEDPKLYLQELTEYNRLLEESNENGIEHCELRGPTFMFKNKDGVPVIPERV